MTGIPKTRRLLITAATLAATGLFILTAGAQQPESISIGQPDWDPTRAAFVIEFSATASLAGRAVDEGYVLDTTLVIRDVSGEVVNMLRDIEPVVRLETRDGGRGMVPLQPQTIEWPDWRAGTFRIQAITELTTAQGEAVHVFGYTGAMNSYRLVVN